MSTCRCCNNKNADALTSLCDRCNLGWNECCVYRIAVDQNIEDSVEYVCGDLGFYHVPVYMEMERIDGIIKKVKEIEGEIKE